MDSTAKPLLFYSNTLGNYTHNCHSSHSSKSFVDQHKEGSVNLFSLIEQDGLKETWIFTFMIDIPFLLENCPFLDDPSAPLFIISQQDAHIQWFLNMRKKNDDNIKFIFPDLPPYGSNHGKMVILFYDRVNGNSKTDSKLKGKFVRIVIHTGNMLHCDTFMRSEGVYTCDFPLISSEPNTIDLSLDESDNENEDSVHQASSSSSSSSSIIEAQKNAQQPKDKREHPHDFGIVLKAYVSACCGSKMVKKLDQYDFSYADVALVASIPGLFEEPDDLVNANEQHVLFGQSRIKQLIQRECVYNPDLEHRMHSEKWPLIVQFTSMGSQKDERGGQGWIANDLAYSFGIDIKDPSSEVQIVIPTVDEIASGLLGYSSGSSTPIGSSTLLNYQGKIHREIKDRLHKWGNNKDEKIGITNTRSEATPHIKSYCRYNPKNPKELGWVCITSSNASKAAWGYYTTHSIGDASYLNVDSKLHQHQQKKKSKKLKLKILSFEIGVMFLPSISLAALEHRKRMKSLTNSSSFPKTLNVNNYKSVQFITEQSQNAQSKKRPRSPSKDKANIFHSSSSSTLDSNADDDIEEIDHEDVLKIIAPLPYPLPPFKYKEADRCWCSDLEYKKPDRYGSTYPMMVELYGEDAHSKKYCDVLKM